MLLCRLGCEELRLWGTSYRNSLLQFCSVSMEGFVCARVSCWSGCRSILKQSNQLQRSSCSNLSVCVRSHAAEHWTRSKFRKAACEVQLNKINNPVVLRLHLAMIVCSNHVMRIQILSEGVQHHAKQCLPVPHP
jgi:hypothetical protein